MMRQKNNHKQSNNSNKHYFIYRRKRFLFIFVYFCKSSQFFSINKEELENCETINLVDNNEEGDLDFSDETIQNFIKYVQRETIQLTNENVVKLNYLANKYKINSLIQFTTSYINEHQNELVIQILSIYQDNLLFETKTYEDILSKNLINYIEDDRLLSLKIPILYRVLSKFLEENKTEPNIDKIVEFCFKCLDKYGRDASSLFEIIDFDKNNTDYMNRLLTNYSKIFDFSFINRSLLKFCLEHQNENSQSNIHSSSSFEQNQKQKITNFEDLILQQQKTIEILKDEISQLKNEQVKMREEMKIIQEKQVQKEKSFINELKNDMDETTNDLKKSNDTSLNDENDPMKVMALMCTNNFENNSNIEIFNKLEGEMQVIIINQMIPTMSNTFIRKIADLLSFLSNEAKKSKSKVYQNANYIFINSCLNTFDEKMQKKQKYSEIGISSEMTEILFQNESINSSVFSSFIEDFTSFYVEIRYPSKQFDELYNNLLELKKHHHDQLKISVFIHGLKETNFKFTQNRLINKVKLDSSVSIIQGINNRGSNGSFYDCSSLAQINIPPSVTVILQEAFEFCQSLTYISIPPSVRVIGRKAFNGCTSLDQIIFEKQSSLEIIGDYAFSECSNLICISIPSSVTKIKKYAFKGCRSLKKAMFDDQSSLNTIEKYAFNECSALISIKIPPSVINIGFKAFDGCSSLSHITISPSINLFEIGIQSNVNIQNI